MRHISAKLALPLLAIPLLLSVTACGGKDEKTASQVAAKVNDDEISVHQINFVLSRSGANAPTPEAAAKLRREVLDKLVDQQLVVAQAVEKKLDRSPAVVMALEAARRDVLARAYIEQLSAAVAKPSTEEAKKYFQEHPQLFGERRIYNIQEVVFPTAPGLKGEVEAQVAAGKPIEEIAAWLKSKNIKFAGGGATKPAEQIPLELLPKVHALKDGEGMVVEAPQTITAMRVIASQAAPVTEAEALPKIQQFLFNQRAGESTGKELAQLKAKAKISYAGEFAGTAPAAPAAAPAAAETAAAPASDASIEKGVAGLK
ncbi:peptidyl-prolyl cis-trans isomerase, EpsD family [Chitinimonas arctica]|uniref:Peptidyl-prolyl cis-trans isomerase, EpsD family n=1 Tax=Chitinimonas arctica TaxID=2594795 RepID=A0A516SET2_9NEIS|nr:EpsD family peptidyl-prolyl cis-trans isomerase [Chitinimonas arctica]QDQ26667.1 peptidyl-prolyl cis-trans isomerase, EpsD family [Chitinimonas arctica]